jgi:hypothetical protein
MTDHPAKAAGCTKGQIAAFEEIAAGVRHHGWSKKTIAALREKKLIEEELRTIGVDRFGPINVSCSYVPTPIHMQWCEWCSEQPEIAEVS